MADIAQTADSEGREVQKDKSAISPMDYNDFQRRFKSYLINNWSRMPLELSPVACSKNGWRLVSDETIYCDFCNRSINVILPKKNYEFYKTVTKSLEERLITEHRPGCVWRSGLDFPEYFLTEETEDGGQLEERLLPSCRELSKYSETFTEIKSFVKVKCIEDTQEELEIFADQNGVDVISLTIAAHGWHIKNVENNIMLHCRLCCRKLALWNKGDKVIDLGKHLAWCPWIHSTSSTATPIVNRISTYISQHLSRKRKRQSEDYHTSYQRKEELKAMVKCMRASLS